MSVLIAALSIAALFWPQPKPPRHHIYWCHMVAHQDWQGYRYTHTMGLPCMYRTNDPVSV